MPGKPRHPLIIQEQLKDLESCLEAADSNTLATFSGQITMASLNKHKEGLERELRAAWAHEYLNGHPQDEIQKAQMIIDKMNSPEEIHKCEMYSKELTDMLSQLLGETDSSTA